MIIKRKTKNEKRKVKSGFTLVEIMVAVSLFAIVAVITTGALVTASDVNRKAQAIKVAIDNLNFAIDSMVLNLQSARQYHCLTESEVSALPDNPTWLDEYNNPRACSPPSLPGGIAFNLPPCPPSETRCEKVIYRLKEDGQQGHIQVWRWPVGVTNPVFADITAPEIDIEFFKAEVSLVPNRVLLTIKGRVNDTTNTEFNFQTTVYERK